MSLLVHVKKTIDTRSERRLLLFRKININSFCLRGNYNPCRNKIESNKFPQVIQKAIYGIKCYIVTYRSDDTAIAFSNIGICITSY